MRKRKRICEPSAEYLGVKIAPGFSSARVYLSHEEGWEVVSSSMTVHPVARQWTWLRLGQTVARD
jgi:hypothetical protein